VQKYCSLTSHTRAGIHVTFSNVVWNRLPSDLQELADKQFNEKALEERADWQVMTKKEIANLTTKGLTFNSPDPQPFREVLHKTGFYPEMKAKTGDKTWALLEKYVGVLT
jgi:TRAP-type C4-dicarboxylate transport system substrate-binding protein